MSYVKVRRRKFEINGIVSIKDKWIQVRKIESVGVESRFFWLEQ